MSLLFDPQTGKITYNGKEVGEHRFDGHASTVRIALEYSTAASGFCRSAASLMASRNCQKANLPSPRWQSRLQRQQ